MADLLIDLQSAPTTPSAGGAVVYVDTKTKRESIKDDTGMVRGQIDNHSIAAQVITAASRTYIAGSALAIPTNKLQVGTKLRWRFNMTKTSAAGIAASTIDICVGTLGTTGDAARVSFTKPAGTAVADEGWVEITAIVRSIGATGVMVGEFRMTHNLQITGHMVIPCACVNTISAGFDMTVVDLIVGVCITTGASDAITIQMVDAEAVNI